MESKVSYSDKTYMDSKEFRTRLESLGKKLNLTVARYYLQSGYKDPMLSDDLYQEIDSISEIRKRAIQREMTHAIAQAELSGVKLSEKTMDGSDLSIGFKKEVTDKVPSLGVYGLFMFYTKDELEKLRDQIKTSPSIGEESDEISK